MHDFDSALRENIERHIQERSIFNTLVANNDLNEWWWWMTMVVVMIMPMVMINIDENDPIWQANKAKMKIPKNPERFQ